MSTPAATTPTHRDRSVLWGVLGILFSWFFLVGLLLSIASINQAREHRRTPVVGAIGVVMTVGFLIFWIVKLY